MLAGGAYPAMLALGMMKAAPADVFNLQGSGKGKKIIILGAGLAGMSAAYELEKLGYDCTILEARQRAGGRCFSVRNGTTNEENNHPTQTAVFDDGLYFNAGPSRIAHHHQITLHYCKELGIPLETYNNVNESAYYFAEGKGPLSNKKIRIKEIQNDVRGYTSELLAKAMDNSQLDAALTKEDTQKIIEFLRAEGGLDIDKLYKASSRRGYTQQPAEANKDGVIAEAYKLQDIIASGLMDPDFYNVTYYTYELQMTMFQAIGGMDKIATALQQKLKNPIKFGAEVTDIKNETNGVAITYKTKDGLQKIMAILVFVPFRCQF